MKPHDSVKWHLRELLAKRGIFITSDLQPLLAKRGVELSREQVYRLVTQKPERLSTSTLAALCRILDCTPSDLLEPIDAEHAERKKAVGAEEPELKAFRPTRAKITRPRFGK